MIKTICMAIKSSEKFDSNVNAAVSEGWRLVRRDVLPGPGLLYAELVQEEEDDLHALLEAARRIKLECERSEDCKDCHLCGICDHQTPDEWPHTGHHEDGGAG